MRYFLIISFLGLVVFGNSLFNGFAWDDVGQILNNKRVHSISNLADFFKGGTFDPGNNADKLSGTYYRPLMTTFFSFTYSIFGENTFFFHFFQLMIHIANSVMVFVLFSFFFPKKLSFLLSLFFLIHPMNVESVVYISDFQDVLFFFFGMLGLLTVVKISQSKARIKTAHLIGLSTVLLASLLSKEAGVVFVIVLVLFVFLFHKRKPRGIALPPLLSIGAYLFLRYFVAEIAIVPQESPLSESPVFIRLIIVPKTILYYLKTFFVPIRLSVAQMWESNVIFQGYAYALGGGYYF